MTRVTGIGGVFLTSRDPQALTAWYRDHLGIELQPWGGAVLHWKTEDNPHGVGSTVWNVMPADTGYLAPSTSGFMVNYRVADLRTLIARLRAEGVPVVGDIEESEFGRFGWVLDPDGNKLELWEPPAGR